MAAFITAGLSTAVRKSSVFVLKTAGPRSLAATSLFFATLTLPFSSVTAFTPLVGQFCGSWVMRPLEFPESAQPVLFADAAEGC